MSSRQRDIDKGQKALLERVTKAKSGVVDVGIFSDKGSEAAKKGKGVTVLDVATFNEFGLGVPERSFLRGYVDENEARIKGMIKVLALAVEQGKFTKQQALDRLGLQIVGEIQKRIASSIPPPNAPSTIAKKGSSTTLVDTGQLRSSITHKVRP